MLDKMLDNPELNMNEVIIDALDELQEAIGDAVTQSESNNALGMAFALGSAQNASERLRKAILKAIGS